MILTDMITAIPVRDAQTGASFLQRLFPTSRRRKFSINGIEVVADTGYAKYWDLHRGRYWEDGVFRVFELLLGPGDQVVDVGANWGLFTILAASLVGSTGRVLSIEPGRLSIEQMGRHTALLPQVQIVEAACSDERGITRFHVPRFRSDGGSHISSTERLRVSVVMLDDLISAHALRQPIRLLKIDVEGVELRVLRGAASALSAKVFDFIVMETGIYAERYGGAAENSLRLLSSFGYKYQYRVSASNLLPVGPHEYATFNDNVLAAASEIEDELLLG